MRIRILTWCRDAGHHPADVEEKEDLPLGDKMVRGPFERALAAPAISDRHRHQLRLRLPAFLRMSPSPHLRTLIPTKDREKIPPTAVNLNPLYDLSSGSRERSRVRSEKESRRDSMLLQRSSSSPRSRRVRLRVRVWGD